MKKLDGRKLKGKSASVRAFDRILNKWVEFKGVILSYRKGSFRIKGECERLELLTNKGKIVFGGYPLTTRYPRFYIKEIE